jgi:Animal haem peroxidase
VWDDRRVATARDFCLAPSRPVDAPLTPFAGRYARLLPDLPPLDCDDDQLLALGLAAAVSDDEMADGGEAAGWPVFGQFVAHDITADRSPLTALADAARLGSARSPRANLECLYGDGPVGAPYLYSRDDPAKLLEAGHDVPRNSEGTALLGDPRNDVHQLIAQLHVLFVRAHNQAVDHLREKQVAGTDCFAAARRATTWHYQWIVVHDFLGRLVGAELVEEILDRGPRWYRPGPESYIPFEFADAAFRYGHSQMRQTYRLNDRLEPLSLFPDLLGFRPIDPARRIDWSLFVDRPGAPPAQRAKRIDGLLPRALVELPAAITGEVEREGYRSLAGRDLQRGYGLGLPSGEAVARAFGEQPLDDDELGLRRAHGWTAETPLWLYVLREAQARGDGDRLGPVGGRIVAEVLVGIVRNDPESYLAVAPDWRPTLGSRDDAFGLADLLEVVDPAG